MANIWFDFCHEQKIWKSQKPVCREKFSSEHDNTYPIQVRDRKVCVFFTCFLKLCIANSESARRPQPVPKCSKDIIQSRLLNNVQPSVTILKYLYLDIYLKHVVDI